MPVYTWTAKDQAGKPVVREVESNSVDESKAVLEAEGLTELSLAMDDIMNESISGFSEEKPTIFGEELKVGPADHVKHLGRARMTLAGILAEGLGNSKGLVLLALALAGYQFYRGNTLSALLALLGLVLWLLLIVCVALPGIYYGKLHRAADWHRWDEVLRLVAKPYHLRCRGILAYLEQDFKTDRAGIRSFAGNHATHSSPTVPRRPHRHRKSLSRMCVGPPRRNGPGTHIL